MGSKLSDKAKIELLKIAKTAIKSEILCVATPNLEAVDESLKERRGVFVTLRKSGRLRGCIGQIIPRLSLGEAIAEIAVASATSDPRFHPVAKYELDQISIEISALSEMKKVERTDEIKVGTHGLYVKRGDKSGLLLPQVATDHGWNATTFLEQTCQKAQLSADAWKDENTELYIFEAEVFREEGMKDLCKSAL